MTDGPRIDAAALIVADLQHDQRNRRRHFLPALLIVAMAVTVALVTMGLRPDLLQQPWWQLLVQCLLWLLCLMVFPAIGLGLVFPSRPARVGLAAGAVGLTLIATLGLPQGGPLFGADEHFHFKGGCGMMIIIYAAAVLLIAGVSWQSGVFSNPSDVPEITIALHEVTPISLRFSSAEDLQDARLSLQLPEGVALAGHTDRSGDASYNVELSKRRAQNTAQEIQRNGVTARLLVKGRHLGQHMFIVPLRSLADHSVLPGVELGANCNARAIIAGRSVGARPKPAMWASGLTRQNSSSRRPSACAATGSTSPPTVL